MTEILSPGLTHSLDVALGDVELAEPAFPAAGFDVFQNPRINVPVEQDLNGTFVICLSHAAKGKAELAV